jgi:tetratricopeptide (TPR) repeat protein
MPLPPDITALIRKHPLGTPRKTEQVLSGELEGAAQRYATYAAYVGDDLELWKVWLAIQQARGLDLTSALGELPPQGRRFLGVAQLEAGEDDVGLLAYARYLKSPGKIGPFSHETKLFLDALSRCGRGDEAMQWVGTLEGRSDTTPVETLWAASHLHATGKLAEAQERLQSVLTRHPDWPDGWELSAQIARALGDTSRAVADAEKAAKRRAPSAFDYDENVAAFQRNPGQTLVPSEAPGPHWYGGGDYAMPACAGCGYTISQWFWLDLTAITELHELLPNWPGCPLLGCSACMVWMGRHDYSVDHAEKCIVLRNVAISTKEFGKPFDAPPKLQRRYAKLVPTKPTDSPFDVALGPMVGGAPLWTQSPELALCPECDEPMVYVAAMTTPEAFEPPFVINNESGFQYHFACNACRTLSVIAQWT